MMQSCLPPGNPPMKPLDLFDRAVPSVWWIHCRNAADEWDVVGLFNFENKPEQRAFDFAQLGLTRDDQASVFEFWEQKFLGIHKRQFTVTLPAQSSRILALHKTKGRPQIIGTDLQLLQGYHELKQMDWDEKGRVLSGDCERMPGISGKLFVYVPIGFEPHFDFPLGDRSAALTHIEDRLWAYEIQFGHVREHWVIPFDAAKK
jgi:hypothetical protein